MKGTRQSRIECPVCRGGETRRFFPDYLLCPDCEAVFCEPGRLPGREEERERYLLHNNNPDDPGYRDFLFRLAGPLLERLPPARAGLDYGCGPGPALSRILEEAGHRVHLYDPFFYPDRSIWNRTYDFITCTETAEHFHNPAREFARLDRLLKPGGWLAVMTAFRPDDRDFPSWYYRRDPTHVVFYREATFRRLSERFGWDCEFPARDVFLAVKK